MSLLYKAGAFPISQLRANLNSILKWNSRYLYLEIAVVISLAIASWVYGRHLLDLSIPADGDVRSHIFKIEILHSYLAQLSWPQWVPYWYDGIPLDQYYPPGFYFLGAIFTFVFKHAVIAYKFLLLLTLTACGLATYYFSRRFLKLDRRLAILCLLAYGTSTPLLINFMFGEGPNLLGWSASLAFMAVYLGNAAEGRISGLMGPVLPGFLLGITILIHPFPAMFAIMAVALFHIIRLLHSRPHQARIGPQFAYLAAVFGIGAAIGAYYWIPAFLTLEYASPIYAFTRFNWPGGTLYILAMALLALAVGGIARAKGREGLQLDFLIACLCLAGALGFGATNYLPLGLGSFVQEFRFATIITPFFAILLIVFPLNRYGSAQVGTGRVAAALTGGAALAALVLLLDNREMLAAEAGKVPGLFQNSLPQLILAVVPYFVVLLFLALSRDDEAPAKGRDGFAVSLAAGACLVLLVSVIPYMYTDKQINMGRLFSYVDNYQQPEYSALMQSVRDGRLVVPLAKGYLSEGDSPVTFGWRWQVETVNGPYNQGDPKFFKHTVHLEWEERWLDYRYTRENLMQECAAKYIFIRDSFGLPSDSEGLRYTAQNDYGQILELDQEVYHAATVTPILLDVRDPRAATEFFNILLPRGYRIVLADVQDIDGDLAGKFDYVMVDDESQLSKYEQKTVFLLSNANSLDDVEIAEEDGIIKLRLPYIAFTDRYCYHGEDANFYAWVAVDLFEGSRLTPEDLAALESMAGFMGAYLDRLEYMPASYESTTDRIEIKAEPGFTLVKDSYFPYWRSGQGEVASTSQGFMLVYSDDSQMVLSYKRPPSGILAAILTVIGLVAIFIALAASAFTRHHRKRPAGA